MLYAKRQLLTLAQFQLKILQKTFLINEKKITGARRITRL